MKSVVKLSYFSVIWRRYFATEAISFPYKEAELLAKLFLVI